MNEEIHLSRLLITGDLDMHTPKDVLKEVADAHDIHFPDFLEIDDNRIIRDDFLNKLNTSSHSQPKVKNNPKETEYLSVAKFVNKHVEWPPEALREAFDILKTYMCEEIPLPEANFPYGTQVPANPFRLNACVLYRICKDHSIPVRFYHTIDQMATVIQLLVRPEEIARSLFRTKMNFVKTDHIPSLYLISTRFMEVLDVSDIEDEEGPSQSISYPEEIEAVTEIFDNPDEVLLRVPPRNKSESIVLAAKNFKIDLTSCEDPITEYKNLLKTSSTWIPIDSRMKQERKKNPMAFLLSAYFNPCLPHPLYDDDDLTNMALIEGFTSEELRREGAYSLLQTAILSSTFYHGKYSTIINKKTPILWKNVNKLSFNSVICFGTLRTSLTAFSYKEIAENIVMNKNFRNPLDKEGHCFPELAIRKLKKLTLLTRSNETKTEASSRKELARAIELAELFSDETNAKIRDFYIYYESLGQEDKDKIIDILQAFFYLAMYTRAWNPEHDKEYPIAVSIVDNQEEVDLRVTQGIATLERLCEEDEELGNRFYDLPLIKYKGGWQISSRDIDGKTLVERLKILKAGVDHDEQVSCMRLTSNWFAASVYRYMVIIGLDPPFDIERLRWIS